MPQNCFLIRAALPLFLASTILAGCSLVDQKAVEKTVEQAQAPAPEKIDEETSVSEDETETAPVEESGDEVSETTGSPASGEDCPLPQEVPVAAPQCPEPKRCPICPAAIVNEKAVLGEVERVKLKPQGFVYKARIDTGAEGTSIHAEDIVRFERDGDRWVRFKLINPNTGELEEFEQEVVRRVRIKQTELDEMERRLVVSLTMSIGPVTQQVDVSLTDRSHMEFDVLIGRNFLRNLFVVDVSQSNLQ